MKETISRVSLRHCDHLDRENDEGSVEYKWKLVGISEDRFEHLLTQMKFRVAEGQGECIYEVGVADNGLPRGLPEADFQETIATLQRMADRLQCDLNVVYEKVVQESPLLKCAEVTVRKFCMEDVVDVRISMCGHVGSGKSTLVGVLTTGILDNGRGSARQKVFNHLHELKTGLTSSISQQIIGFGACGDIVNYNTNDLFQESPERIAEMSCKLCTLYDLAGHEKYLKTTVTGMTGPGLDYACLVVRADKGIQRMTREHLGLCVSLDIPVFCVVTCADLTKAMTLDALSAELKELLQSSVSQRDLYWVKDSADVIVSARKIKCGTIVPIFFVSNVTGHSLDLLRTFLNFLPARREWDGLVNLPAEVVLDKWFSQVSEEGMVVSGLVEQGCVQRGDRLLLGPDERGAFESVVICNIQVKRVNAKKAEAGIHATYAICHATDTSKPPSTMNLRKGMVLAHPQLAPSLAAYWRFEADMVVLFAAGKIQNSLQPIFHCRMIRQKVRLLWPEDRDFRTGEQCKVQVEFLFTAEYLKEGLHFVIIDGSTKGIGTITRLLLVDAPPLPPNASKSAPRGRCHSSGAPRTAGSGRPRFFSGRSPVSAEKIDWTSPQSPLAPASPNAAKAHRESAPRLVSFGNLSKEPSCDVDSAVPKMDHGAVEKAADRWTRPASELPRACPRRMNPKKEHRLSEKYRRIAEKQDRKAAVSAIPQSTEFDVYAD